MANVFRRMSLGIVATTAASALAVTGTWNYESAAQLDGLTPETAAIWTAECNWFGGVPQDSGDVAELVDTQCSTSMANIMRFISLPSAGLTVSGIRSRMGVNLYMLGMGGRVSMEGSASFGYGGGTPAIRDVYNATLPCRVFWYVPILFKKDMSYVDRGNFCGTIAMSTAGQDLVVTDEFRHLMNWAADSDSDELTDVGLSSCYQISSLASVALHGRMGSSGAEGTWLVSAGSPYLRRTGDFNELAPGCPVSGDGIPQGAWLKRVFTDALIEISAPATGSSADVETGTRIAFGAYRPKTVQHLARVRCLGDVRAELNPN